MHDVDNDYYEEYEDNYDEENESQITNSEESEYYESYEDENEYSPKTDSSNENESIDISQNEGSIVEDISVSDNHLNVPKQSVNQELEESNLQTYRRD